MRRKLPIHITLLLVVVFYSTCWQAIRFAAGLAWSDTLRAYEGPLLPLYIEITGAVWTLTGLFLLWCMWRGKHWTRRAFTIASSLYAAWVWADRLFVQTQLRANWPFDLLATILLLIFTDMVVLDPHNRTYFERETYERES
ncbi:MAG TPA: hypothetical protein VLZ89_16090 [Anaerolineales bacterium]|nr:hypothetical protein [Anaerolineales bacterium]